MLNRIIQITNQRLCYQSTKATRAVPAPSKKFPDVTSLLKKVRGIESLADKFNTWETLFKTDRFGLKEMGINPSQRKKILGVRHRLTLGIEPVKQKKHPSPVKSKKK